MLALCSGAVAQVCHARLTRAAPTQTCATPDLVAAVVEIPVRPLANHGRGPIDLRIGFARATGPTIRSTALSLYPVDRPQTFAIRVPAEGRRMILTLMPGVSPLEVEVGPVRWRDAPR